jgi:NAD(P)-dependent dehydrogenase (short-subunit alcohol dehydrogenase family)
LSAELPAGRTSLLIRRSWSGNGWIRTVRVSTGGRYGQPAEFGQAAASVLSSPTASYITGTMIPSTAEPRRQGHHRHSGPMIS